MSETLVRAPVQPAVRDFALADGVFVKRVAIPTAGMILPQHAHAYDHTSFIAAGAVRVSTDAGDLGTFTAPAPIFIAARVKHTFVCLSDNTVVLCIHRVDRTGEIEIAEEHHLLPPDLCGDCNLCGEAV